jgi:hypothetical protein
MGRNIPVFDVPKYNSSTSGGALAVAMAAAKRPQLDLRDLPNPPAFLTAHKPS